MRKILVVLILLWLLLCPAMAQAPMFLYGDIKSETDQPIMDALIIFKKGLNNSKTDKNGRFRIFLKYSADTLEITHPGYKPIELALTDQIESVIHLKMNPLINK